MSAPVTSQKPGVRYTVDDLAQFPDDSKLRELSDGRIVGWDKPTALHGWFIVALSHLLNTYVVEHGLGSVVGGDPLVLIQGSKHDARGPDVAFYRRGHLPKDLRASAADTTPDFVIEVLSPSDRAGEVQEKIGDWLRAGVRLLWYVNPETGTTMAYYAGGISRVGVDETLDGHDIVPGFTLRLRDLFDRLAALKEAEGE